MASSFLFLAHDAHRLWQAQLHLCTRFLLTLSNIDFSFLKEKPQCCFSTYTKATYCMTGGYFKNMVLFSLLLEAVSIMAACFVGKMSGGECFYRKGRGNI